MNLFKKVRRIYCSAFCVAQSLNLLTKISLSLDLAKENSGRIGQVCHDHSDVFLASVGKVVALGGPSADLANKLRTAEEELELKTAGPMQQNAVLWEEATASHARARALYVMVQACHKVAIQLEKARKQAALGRPRGALVSESIENPSCLNVGDGNATF